MRVYPRACGGTCLIRRSDATLRSIPAPAGEPAHEAGDDVVSGGSIPAPAGEPMVAPGIPQPWVYPRACGGTTCKIDGSRWYRFTVYPRACGGTIGNQLVVVSSIGVQVYPRACGGTASISTAHRNMNATGLSPRLRGNHD